MDRGGHLCSHRRECPCGLDGQTQPVRRDGRRRYKQILARDPYDASAFSALKTMYARYRTIQKLESELGTDWASSVIKARLHPDAEHWRIVVARKEDDARALFELAQLERKPELYERALAATRDPAQQRRSLEKLISIAIDHFESDEADELLARLTALPPKDPQIWLDRAGSRRASSVLVEISVGN